MPRKIRCIIPGLPHHALQRGNNRQTIFYQEEDKVFFLKHLQRDAKDNKVYVGAYCLMTNHFHFMLFPETSEGFIKLMKSILQRYSQYFNSKYKRTGKIWENRYKLNIVEPELAWVIARYIERNPLRAKIVSKAEEYKYSSAAAHLKGKKDFLLTKDIISIYAENYIQYFYEPEVDNEDKLNEIREIIKQQKAIGSDNFIEKIEKEFKVSFKIGKRGRPKKIGEEK